MNKDQHKNLVTNSEQSLFCGYKQIYCTMLPIIKIYKTTMFHKALFSVTCCTSSLPFAIRHFPIVNDLSSPMWNLNYFLSITGTFLTNNCIRMIYLKFYCYKPRKSFKCSMEVLKFIDKATEKTSTTFLRNWNSGPCNNRRSACNEWA